MPEWLIWLKDIVNLLAFVALVRWIYGIGSKVGKMENRLDNTEKCVLGLQTDLKEINDIKQAITRIETKLDMFMEQVKNQLSEKHRRSGD